MEHGGLLLAQEDDPLAGAADDDGGDEEQGGDSDVHAGASEGGPGLLEGLAAEVANDSSFRLLMVVAQMPVAGRRPRFTSPA